ncbi:MAG: hypothetical protein J5829_06700 [Lachnospiraceae bacterium]|nr:hypothetical protein [Lachnospiraceae bacterium]
MNEKTIGFLAGIAVSLVIVYIALKKLNSDGKATTKYDERQKAVRGKAYTYAFWAVLLANCILLALSVNEPVIERLGPVLFFVPVFIGITVQITYSIFNDGYVGLNTNLKKYLIFMIFVTIINVGVGVMAAINGQVCLDGRLQGPFINILCGILFLIVVVDLLIKNAVENREA